MSERKTQTDLILSFMLDGNRISPIVALEHFGCFRLGARIWDAKQAGWNIQSELVSANGKHYSEYWIPSDKPKIEVGQATDPSGSGTLVVGFGETTTGVSAG